MICHLGCGQLEDDGDVDMEAGMLLAATHIRLFHPDQYEPVQTWGDGNAVVIDETLEPGDFE